MNLLFAAMLVTASVAGLLLAVLLGRDMGGGGRSSDVYEDQLAEIDRDLDRGVLDEDQARLARAEVERRLLEAAREERASSGPAAGASRPARLLTAVAVGLVPLAAASVYLSIGAPQQQDTAFERRLAPRGNVAVLTERLRLDPQDLDGWIALAETLRQEERYEESLPAYAEALRLSGGQDIRLLGAYGEAMVKAADGEVTKPARELFAEILLARPGDPRATYYLSLAALQRGEAAEAAEAMRELVGAAPEEAPWLPAARDLLAEAERLAAES